MSAEKEAEIKSIQSMAKKQKLNTLSNAMETLNVIESPLYEHTEVGWDSNLDELVLFMLVESCLCFSDDE